MLNAGKSLELNHNNIINIIINIIDIWRVSLEFAYDLFLILISIIYVKIAMTWRLSAEMKSFHTLAISQRLQAAHNRENFLYPYLVGLIEGDGYFSISKKGKYLTYELGIELSIRDVQLIYKIKSLLGVGVVSFRKRKENRNMVILRIRNKNHLKNIIIPIFDKYPMLSSKQSDYVRFKNNLLSDIKYSSDLLEYTRSNEYRNPTDMYIDSIISKPYFVAWLVGFIEAEGCFSIYNIGKMKNYTVASFDISQKDAYILLFAINKYLSFSPSIYKDKSNCFRIKVTSIRSIENIIKFLKKAPVKLMGYKKLQYILWLKNLRKITRYSKRIKIPSKY